MTERRMGQGPRGPGADPAEGPSIQGGQAGPVGPGAPRDAPCRKLRTKLAFSALHDADGAPLGWQRGDGSTAVYWCLETLECAGRDDGLVHAAECRPGRACYQPAAGCAASDEPGGASAADPGGAALGPAQVAGAVVD